MSKNNQAKKYIGTQEASFLLNISAVRLRQLLQQERVVGAYKSGRRWLIPLKKGLPRITKGKRGPVGTWCKRRRQVNTKIHVNREVLAANRKNGTNNPPISVRIGTKTHFCHEADLPGNVKMIYRPHKPLPCGAVLWLEVDPSVVIGMRKNLKIFFPGVDKNEINCYRSIMGKERAHIYRYFYLNFKRNITKREKIHHPPFTALPVVEFFSR